MRISEIRVEGLFDRFNHRIPLNLEDRITIIHGPNGFGKTVILTMVDIFFNGVDIHLLPFAFRTLQLNFDDASSVQILRLSKNHGPNLVSPPQFTLEFRHIDPNGNIASHEPKPPVPEQLSISIGAIEEFVDEIQQIGPRSWKHLGTGEVLSLDDVFTSYWHILPISRPRSDEEMPTWLREIRSSISVRFIKTERLLAPVQPRSRHFPHRSALPSRAVTIYSQQLADLMRKTSSDYVTLSQSLDRTFPARVVAEPQRHDLTMDELRKELTEVEARRSRLIESGLLSQDEPEPWRPPLKDVDETRRGILGLFAEDARKKLSVFDELFKRIDLFKRTINARFLHKTISIDQTGFHLTTADGHKLDLTKLSSGEQQEIVLMYELLFRARKESLILIDEPEISLHVAWQNEFLRDLQHMAELSEFNALLATHSPQIISDRWDLTVELQGPPE